MDTVTSRDGTSIAYQQAGSGRPLVLVTGAFNDHTTCAELAAELSPGRTVITYDRRGRGESGHRMPYSIDREVDDLAALVEHAGGSAAVFGYSSGAQLALKAAADGVAISHLVMYEPPFAFDTGQFGPPDLHEQVADLVAQGRPGDAVALFQTAGVGMPAEFVAQIRQSPMWPALEAMAPSLVYDVTIMTSLASPTQAMADVSMPALILNGTQTWPKLQHAAKTLAEAMPAARYEEVPGGQNHEIPPEATAALVRDFLDEN
ncbi:alpha/beta hydrolase [Asanoa sp. NPDC049573]|uniref:alpha/beta fold hydrolase n=1 Tax=Asanoa sp. NPDC049573 TaxID=3155396 RepID=UPI003427B69A